MRPAREVAIGGREKRRAARWAARCRVVLRDRFGAWTGETEDVGARGCRFVSARAQTVGALVQLTIVSDRLEEALETSGQIVWARRDATGATRAGVLFTGSTRADATTPAAWVEALAAAERGATRAAVEPGRAIALPAGSPSVADDGALARRLAGRARELLAVGQPHAAVPLLRRALALAPGDLDLADLLRRAGG